MFVEYFYYLKDRLPVSITEYMTLMQALNQGLIHNMVEFYYVSRSILCKNEHHFDIYDIAFANFFKDAMIQFPEDIKQEIWDWLQKDLTVPELAQALEAMLKQYLNVEDFKKFLEDLLKKQSRRGFSIFRKYFTIGERYRDLPQHGLMPRVMLLLRQKKHCRITCGETAYREKSLMAI